MDSRIRFDHIAFGVTRIEEAGQVLAGVLGGRPFEGGPGPGYTGAQWEFVDGARLELIEPLGSPDGFLHRFLAARGPGIHHVTFTVPSIKEAAERARSLGYDVVGYQDVHPSWKEAFLHPKQALGIVVQLAEKGTSDGDSWNAGFPFPKPEGEPPPPVRVLGLRMTARRAESARRQWQDLLSAECADDSATLLFRWPESPLRIAVDILENGPEGPTAVEIAAERRVAISDAPHPVLGARFSQV